MLGGLDTFSDENFCYLTTRGRITGKPHEIEIWFVVDDGTAYLMSGGGRRSDWVRNLMANESVDLRIRDRTWRARAYLSNDPDEGQIRRLMAAKYQGWEPGKPLSEWAATAIIVRVRPI
jgi:deazaflavin-dependent oxidoreductase (nitroreductase family)